MIKRLLAHPLTRDLDIDDPETTTRRREIIRDKVFLRRIYEDWYQRLVTHLPAVAGATLELGSGGGFLNELVPNLITSEIFLSEDVDIVLDGAALPFSTRSLRAIVMVDVLHHIPDVRQFLSEARRCLVTGGRIIMVEPWTSPWSKVIYKNLHHEPFLTDTSDWNFPITGPLSGANGALPWIVFERDRRKFEAEYPELGVRTIEPFMPFTYLVSGGVSMRTIMPAFTFPFWRAVDNNFQRWSDTWSMFAFIMVERGENKTASAER